MSFFQNVFTSEFMGSLVLGDRQYSPTFKLRPNSGRGEDIVTVWNEPTYDLSGSDADSNSKANLTISYAIDPDFRMWTDYSVDIRTGASSATAVTATEIYEALVDDVIFNEKFDVTLAKFSSGLPRIQIRQKMAIGRMKFYIVNGGAETVLGFNARAGIAELPSYFNKHTIANRYTYEESIGTIILLSPGTSDVEANLIDNAVDHRGNTLGYDSSIVQADWQLLAGSSGIFTFKKQTVDGSSRITQIIEYPCGAVAGDFAKKTKYTYDGAKTAPDTIAEIPYVLESGDLITP